MGLKISTTIVFEQLLKSDELNKRIVVAQGGSRSGKTFNILVYWIYRLLQEEKKTLTIVRKTLPSLKNSVLKDLIQVLVSVDEPQKIRGMKRDYLYCNEANELKIEDWNQLIFRTTDKVICDLNPSDLNSWVYDLEKRDDCYLFKTTWRDNPFVSDTINYSIPKIKQCQISFIKWNSWVLKRPIPYGVILHYHKILRN